jgi:hypothetical protein
MRFLSSHAHASRDIRDREYVLTGCPLVARDDTVVLVDVSVRIDVRTERDTEIGLDPTEETAWHAVSVLALRLLAEQLVSEELLVGRARIAEALEHGIALAPIGTGVRARVTEVEVRKYDAAAAQLQYEFRVLRA